MVRTSLFERGFSGCPRSAVDLSDRAFRDCGLVEVDRRTAVVLDGRHNGCGRIGHDLRNNACERVIGRFNGRADVSTAAACCGCCGLVGHDTASHSGNGERDVSRFCPVPA